MHFDPEDDRTRSIIVFRPLRGQGHVMASFLIDMDCLGVKDAWWQDDADPAGVRESMKEQTRGDGTRFVKVTLESARKLLAGAIRWTRSHQFRMPGDTLAAARVLGEALDVDNADVSEFGTEEGLLYVGWERDLERALVGVTLDDFLDREDVTCEFLDDAGEMDEEDFDGDDWEEEGEATEEDRQVFELADEMVRLTKEYTLSWCAQNKVEVAPDMETAAKMYIGTLLAQVAAMQEEGRSEKKSAEHSKEMLIELIEQNSHQEKDSFIDALRQIWKSEAGDADALGLRALNNLKKRAVIDVTAEKVLTTEQPCSTPDTPSLPNSSSTTPVP